MTSSPKREFYRPGAAVADLKARFAKLNAFVMARGAWITSVPGAPEITIECLPDSALPDELRAAGYDLREDGEGPRILPAAIVETFTKNADGTLGPLTEGSTQPVTSVVHHTGITRVMRYRSDLARL